MFSKIGPYNTSRGGPWSRDFWINTSEHIQKRHEDEIVSVTLPRGLLQGIKRMMKLTTHGLFLTCTQKFRLYIYPAHSQLFGHNPLRYRQKENPTYVKGWCLAHGGESPSTLVPCPVSTVLPILSNPFLAHTMLQWRHRHQQLRSSCPQ
jgi:hypothetical protein